jgi:putative DNA primase/helicase
MNRPAQLATAPPARLIDEALPPEFTEDRLALDFAETHAHELRYVAAWGRWLTWTGAHWEFENTLRVFDLARKICRAAAARCNKPSISSALAKAITVAVVEMLSRSDRRIAAKIDQWDINQWLLNTPGGIVDLKTGQARPHRQEDYATKNNSRRAGRDMPEIPRISR